MKYHRNLNIVRLRQAGWKLDRLAVKFGISKQRVSQILNPDEFQRRQNQWRRTKRLADQSSV